jgi:hypothetical protein
MNRGLFYYLMPLLLLFASLLQSTTTNRIQVRGVKPDLVLLLVLVGTLIYGGRSGLLWAFIGGIGLDLFSGGPLGSSSLALIAATLLVGIGHRTLSRYHLLVPLDAGLRHELSGHSRRVGSADQLVGAPGRSTGHCAARPAVAALAGSLLADGARCRAPGAVLQYGADVVSNAAVKSGAGESGCGVKRGTCCVFGFGSYNVCSLEHNVIESRTNSGRPTI